MRNFSQQRSTKTYNQVNQSKCRGGKLVPVMAVGFRPNEKGLVRHNIRIELEPIAGRLITDTTGTVTSVFIPNLAVDALYNAANDHPGNTEIFRQRLLDGELMFPMEGESEITKRMGINPRRVGGVKQIDSLARLAHNAAVNYLRQSKYVDCTLIDAANTDITPAMIGDTVLDRFNAVLKPEDRVNGAVNLVGSVPVLGIGVQNPNTTANVTSRSSDGTFQNADGWKSSTSNTPPTGEARLFVEEDPANPGFPNIRADFGLGEKKTLSISDFYMAEKMDELVRGFRDLVDRYPQHGYEQIIRMIHGMSIETGRIPYTVYRREINLTTGIKSGMDGPSLDVYETHQDGMIDFSVPVDGSEFGGTLITFLEVKPEEVIRSRPHPVFTTPLAVDNVAAQELAIHPVPVRMRDLDADIPVGNEEDVAFWVGPEHFNSNYENIGFTRDVDISTVDHRSSMWRYNIPLSVAPDSILYPENLDHYPFAKIGPDDPAVSYSCFMTATIASPVVLGPSPVEDIALLDQEDVFDEE